MTMSGPTAVIARDRPRASYTSTTMGVTPAASSSAAFLLERGVPNISQPALSNRGTSRLPIAPVAPATNPFAAMCVPLCVIQIRYMLWSLQAIAWFLDVAVHGRMLARKDDAGARDAGEDLRA